MHLVQVLEIVEIRQDSAGGRSVLEVIEHAVDLVDVYKRQLLLL